jgi:hypothetical protein
MAASADQEAASGKVNTIRKPHRFELPPGEGGRFPGRNLGRGRTVEDAAVYLDGDSGGAGGATPCASSPWQPKEAINPASDSATTTRVALRLTRSSLVVLAIDLREEV